MKNITRLIKLLLFVNMLVVTNNVLAAIKYVYTTDSLVVNAPNPLILAQNLQIREKASPTFNVPIQLQAGSNLIISTTDITSNVIFNKDITITEGAKIVMSRNSHMKVIEFNGNVTIGGESPSDGESSFYPGNSIVFDRVAESVFNGELVTQKNILLALGSKTIFNKKVKTPGTVTIIEDAEVTFNSTIDADIKIIPGTWMFDDIQAPEITFGQNASGVGHNIIIAQSNLNKTIIPTFKGNVNFDQLIFEKDRDVKFAPNVNLNTLVTNNRAGIGSIEFYGNAKLLKNIGLANKAIREVKFYEKNGNSTITAVNNIDVYTQNLNLGVNNTTINGVVNFPNNPNVITRFINNNKAGKVTVNGAGNQLKFNSNQQLRIILVANSGKPANGNKYEYVLFNGTANNIVLPDAITFESQERNHLVKWHYDAANKKLIGIYDINNFADAVQEIPTANDKVKQVSKIFQGNISGNAEKIVKNYAILSDQKLTQALTKLRPVEPANNNIIASFDAVNTAQDLRLLNQTTITSTSNKENITGLSSGDTQPKYGVWTKLLYGTGTKKQDDVFVKYNINSYGIIIGADTKINEDLTLGTSLTAINSKNKYSGDKSGDKLDLNSYIASIYGHNYFNQQFFVKGSIAAGKSYVNGNEARVISEESTAIAKSKYDNNLLNGNLSLGYHIPLTENLSITPMAGIEYSWISDAKYTETGADITNLRVERSASNNSRGSIGMLLKNSFAASNNFAIDLALHGNVKYLLNSKNSKITAYLDGLGNSIIIAPKKDDKLAYNLGGFVNLKPENKLFIYGLEYNGNYSKKLNYHTFAAKFNLMF